jgi:hypothetical protein
MSPSAAIATSEMAILRRIVDPEEPFPSEEVARAVLRWTFCPADVRRMNRLAEKNRQGMLTPAEEQLLDNYIRVGQTLGILQSKARRSLRPARASKSRRS